MRRQQHPCFVRSHEWRNCFAFGVTSDINDDVRIRQSQHASQQQFICLYSCEDPGRKLFLQLSASSNYHYIMVNKALMEYAGFSEGEEAIAENVEPVPCDAVEVAPLSEEDFKVIEASSSQVEQNFLQQCILVAAGMTIPFYATNGCPAMFRIVKVYPKTIKPVILTANTELHVIPVCSNVAKPQSSTERKTNDQRLSQISQSFKEVACSSKAEDYFDDVDPPQFLRVIPQKFLDFRRSSNFSDVYALHPDPNATYGNCIYVCIRSARAKKAFAILHLLPRNKCADESLDKYQDILKKFEKHCIIPSTFPFLDYERIKFHRLKREDVVSLEQAELCVSPEASETLIDIGDPLGLSIETAAKENNYLFSFNGTSIPLRLKESSSLNVLIKPPLQTIIGNNCGDICYRTTPSTSFELKKNTTDIPQKESDITNWGYDHSKKLFTLKFQSVLLNEMKLWIDYCFANKQVNVQNHLLILGPKGSGKTSILNKLAFELAESSAAVFSRIIDCSSLKGKQSEKIKKILVAEINNCTIRRPAILFLDNVDLIAQSGRDEEHRVLQIERIFSSWFLAFSFLAISRIFSHSYLVLRSLLCVRENFCVVCTATSLFSIHPILLGDGGKRFFGLTCEVSKLTQVGFIYD